MALDSYAGLKQSISDHLERDDLQAFIDDFIDIAEARHAREIRIREMLSSADLTLSEDARTIALPDDFLDFYHLRILVPNANSGRRFLPDLVEVPLHELSRRSVFDAREPRYFALHETLEVDAIADRDYSAELFYFVQLAGLSDSNTSNALLTKAADVYLYASLAATAPFLMHDERVPLWESLYSAARERLNQSSRESRRGGPLVSRVSGATP